MKGKNMETLEQSGLNDTGKSGETNLEEEEKESGYTPKELGEEMLKEAGPYITRSVKETRNEVREKLLKNTYLTEKRKEQRISVSEEEG